MIAVGRSWLKLGQIGVTLDSSEGKIRHESGCNWYKEHKGADHTASAFRKHRDECWCSSFILFILYMLLAFRVAFFHLC